MAKSTLKSGGTLGAHSLTDVYARVFNFAEALRPRLLALCPPGDLWLSQYRKGEGDLVDSPEDAVILAIEGCGNRYVRSAIRPVGIPAQREYLKAIELHANALIELLAGYPSMDGTTADFIKFVNKTAAGRGLPATGVERRMATYDLLAVLRTFARYRLLNNLKPEPGEEREQKVKRKNTYDRLVLGADLLSAWTRITGREAMATATVEGGVRRVSMAVDFLSVAMPPILRAGKDKGLQENLDDQTIRKMVAEIKDFWRNDEHPEFAYSVPDWGSRKLG